MQKLKALVLKERWAPEEEMNEGLAPVQLYFGPITGDFAADVGYGLRGVPGALLAATGFLLPTLLLSKIREPGVLKGPCCYA
jgi:chromate transport protein ChrA